MLNALLFTMRASDLLALLLLQILVALALHRIVDYITLAYPFPNLLAPLTRNALALYGLGINIKQCSALPFTRRPIERETTSFKVACLKVWP